MQCFMFALNPPPATHPPTQALLLLTTVDLIHARLSHPHLLFCLPVVALSDGPGAEGRHKPHLWGTADQDQAARHLLQRLPNPLQLRGTEQVRGPVPSLPVRQETCWILPSYSHTLYPFFYYGGWTSHFLRFGHKGCYCRCCVLSCDPYGI